MRDQNGTQNPASEIDQQFCGRYARPFSKLV
ncbi:hypothetical protein AGROH133_05513 [Agrobacterium tumefaciens]|nr:hypothetical protein AGROH133_05513 [Agrobacterium tumefaciens]